ncbi:hypothetical protein PLESTB_000151700 [Pleodorina starrii]|uniref:Uncharacterized protein n=1 Tax=Pleodorina starrii TaxID=330485 RepID=A0A9W6BBN4_9CHLO|nr:hypothetical protein PLESTM_000450500 [Pleodorina starrii]GLC48815.1 hypothetical protein PLESTB_000151700 [Pleodorina starrii]GLC72554.1 hypothetical protein PLESTF_001264200 [Pleodorina starrii]
MGSGPGPKEGEVQQQPRTGLPQPAAAHAPPMYDRLIAAVMAEFNGQWPSHQPPLEDFIRRRLCEVEVEPTFATIMMPGRLRPLPE